MSDLQSGIIVDPVAQTIKGTLKHVTGYTGWSSDPDEQSGNYLALAFTFNEGGELSVKNGERGPVDLTSDKYLVVRMTEDDIELTLDFILEAGGKTETISYDVSGLTLEEE